VHEKALNKRFITQKLGFRPFAVLQQQNKTKQKCNLTDKNTSD
jgi:hypothetical protein